MTCSSTTAPEAEWRATGLDPEGMDLAAAELAARLAFPERVLDGASLRRTLVALAAAARAKAP